MQLNESLYLIAAQLRLDGGELVRYAAEDTETGWDGGQGAWPVGSLWRPEGQTLYALVRALTPVTVVEIGGWHGCSATHIARALKTNGGGLLVSVDLSGQHGDLIPAELRAFVELVKADGWDYLSGQESASVGLIFEDADHSALTTGGIATVAKNKLVDGGVFVSHDAAHFLVGGDVRAGLTAALAPFAVYLAEPSDCGLAIWQKAAPKMTALTADDGYAYTPGSAAPIEQAEPVKGKGGKARKPK